MKTLLASLLLSSVLTAGAWAYGVDDPGATSCKLFARMYDKGPKGTQYQFLSWAQGYFAARQQVDARPVTLAAEPTMTRLVAYCAAHPADNFTAAVDALWTELAPSRDAT